MSTKWSENTAKEVYGRVIQLILLAAPKDIQIYSVDIAAMMGISRYIARGITNKISPFGMVKKSVGGHRNRETVFTNTQEPNEEDIKSFTKKFGSTWKKMGSIIPCSPKDIIEEVALAVSNCREFRAQNGTHVEFYLDYWRNGYKPHIFLDGEGKKCLFPFQSKPQIKRINVKKIGVVAGKKQAATVEKVPVTIELVRETIDKMEHDVKSAKKVEAILSNLMRQLNNIMEDARKQLREVK